MHYGGREGFSLIQALLSWDFLLQVVWGFYDVNPENCSTPPPTFSGAFWPCFTERTWTAFEHRFKMVLRLFSCSTESQTRGNTHLGDVFLVIKCSYKMSQLSRRLSNGVYWLFLSRERWFPFRSSRATPRWIHIFSMSSLPIRSLLTKSCSLPTRTLIRVFGVLILFSSFFIKATRKKVVRDVTEQCAFVI